MNNKHCNMIKKGLFVSHQGMSLCCENSVSHQMTPSEFWSSDFRKTSLERMYLSSEVDGCGGCYANEINKTPSSRVFYNIYDKIPSSDLPTIIDLDFSNFCNLKCLMCNPVRSSEWAKDKGHGNNGIKNIPTGMIDDLVKISSSVQQMTIHGGEPSIIKEYEYYFECLDKKDKNILPNVNLQVITNATNVNTRFYKLLEKFKSVRLSVSIDAFGKANDYIRWPSNFIQIEKNLRKMVDLPENFTKIEILNSLNVLSMFNYYDFLTWCKKIEQAFDDKDKNFTVVPMKVLHPIQWSPLIAPMGLKNHFIDEVKKFLKQGHLAKNPNLRTELAMLVNRIKKSEPSIDAVNLLKSSVKQLDSQRKANITEYIPNFHQYI